MTVQILNNIVRQEPRQALINVVWTLVSDLTIKHTKQFRELMSDGRRYSTWRLLCVSYFQVKVHHRYIRTITSSQRITCTLHVGSRSHISKAFWTITSWWWVACPVHFWCHSQCSLSWTITSLRRVVYDSLEASGLRCTFDRPRFSHELLDPRTLLLSSDLQTRCKCG